MLHCRNSDTSLLRCRNGSSLDMPCITARLPNHQQRSTGGLLRPGEKTAYSLFSFRLFHLSRLYASLCDFRQMMVIKDYVRWLNDMSVEFPPYLGSWFQEWPESISQPVVRP